MSIPTTPVRLARAGVVAFAAPLLLLALLVATTTDAPLALAAVGAGLALGGLLAATLATRAVLAGVERVRPVGRRGPRHREVLERIAAPAHPSTPGRPLSRAPGAGSAAA